MTTVYAPLTSDESVFTVDPDLFESDTGLGQSALYYDEAGARQSYPQGNALQSCDVCGTPIILGVLEDGTGITVEPQTRTYVLFWRQKMHKHGAPQLPTLTQSRTYPAHRCRS